MSQPIMSKCVHDIPINELCPSCQLDGIARGKGKPLTFEALRNANVQRNQEWDPENKLTPAFSGLEFSGETGELLELAALMIDLATKVGSINNKVKKMERERLGIPGSRVTFEELASEFADAQITLDLLAMRYNVDLGEATRGKFNFTSEKMGLKERL